MRKEEFVSRSIDHVVAFATLLLQPSHGRSSRWEIESERERERGGNRKDNSICQIGTLATPPSFEKHVARRVTQVNSSECPFGPSLVVVIVVVGVVWWLSLGVGSRIKRQDSSASLKFSQNCESGEMGELKGNKRAINVSQWTGQLLATPLVAPLATRG